MTFWKIDKSYFGDGDYYYYYVLPYNVKGTLLLHFGFDLKHGPRFHYFPWYTRFTSFISFIMKCRPTEEWAIKIAKKWNNKFPYVDEIRDKWK